MDEEAITLLANLVRFKEISLYDLAEQWARSKRSKNKDTFDEVVRLVYKLASRGLVQIETVVGEDGAETILKPTSSGETYLKSSAAEKAIR